MLKHKNHHNHKQKIKKHKNGIHQTKKSTITTTTTTTSPLTKNKSKIGKHPAHHTQQRGFRGIYNVDGSVDKMMAVFPEPKKEIALRTFGRFMKERQDAKRWKKLAEANAGFTADYAIEVYKLMMEELTEKLGVYNYKIYVVGQHAYDTQQLPAQHYHQACVAQSEVFNECFEYLQEFGLDIPWTMEEIHSITQTIPQEPAISPLPEIFLAETQRLIHESTHTIKLNQTPEDKAMAEKLRELRELVRDHDIFFLATAFALDPHKARTSFLNVDTCRRVMQRFNTVFEQHHLTQRIEQLLKKDVQQLGSFDRAEIEAWRFDRLDVVLSVISPYWQSILQSEFKLKGTEAYFMAQHSIRSNMCDPQIRDLMKKQLQSIEYFLTPPPDTPETRALMNKEQNRRRTVLEQAQKEEEKEEKKA